MNARITALLAPGLRTALEQERDARRVDESIRELLGGKKPSRKQVEKLLKTAEFHLLTGSKPLL